MTLAASVAWPAEVEQALEDLRLLLGAISASAQDRPGPDRRAWEHWMRAVAVRAATERAEPGAPEEGLPDRERLSAVYWREVVGLSVLAKAWGVPHWTVVGKRTGGGQLVLPLWFRTRPLGCGHVLEFECRSLADAREVPGQAAWFEKVLCPYCYGEAKADDQAEPESEWTEAEADTDVAASEAGPPSSDEAEALARTELALEFNRQSVRALHQRNVASARFSGKLARSGGALDLPLDSGISTIVPGSCPACGNDRLLTKARRSDGKPFVSCARYPHCKWSASLGQTVDGQLVALPRSSEVATAPAPSRLPTAPEPEPSSNGEVTWI